jgi:5-methylthioadenosine/S-adenosylhomocysteine deaminase
MKQEPVDLVINAAWLVPVVPENTVFNQCSVAVRDGKILAICPRSESARRFKAATTVDLDNHILMPGLVNAHGHAAMSLLRGYADDLDLHCWLNDRIWPAEAQWISEEFVRDGTELALAEMIASGTTCFADMYFFPDQTAEAARKAGLRSQIAFPVINFPTAWARDGDEYIHKGLALRDNFKDDPLVNIAFGPHALYTVADNLFEKIAAYANELDTMVQIHLHESRQEVENGLTEHGKNDLERLASFGLLSANTQCVHMVALDRKDMELVAESKAHVVHCPRSNMKLGNGICPLPSLLELGVNVALGTDGAASNNSLDMFGEMQFASLLAKGAAGDPTIMDAHTAIRLATLNGARALGQDSRIGSIESGKYADMIAINIDTLPTQPLYNAASQLVYTQSGQRVSHSWVAGKCLMENGCLTTLSRDELTLKAQSWRQKIQP